MTDHQLANASEDLSSIMEEKNAAIREAARLKIQLDSLKPDYEAECTRSEQSRKEKVKIGKELTEVKTALDEALAEAVSVRKRCAFLLLESGIVSSIANCELLHVSFS